MSAKILDSYKSLVDRSVEVSTTFDRKSIRYDSSQDAELSFSTNGDSLSAVLPSSANLATPGFYMLFLIDDEGTPSVAEILKLSSSTNQPPLQPEPPPTTGGNLVADGGFDAISLAPNAYQSISAGDSVGPWMVVSGGVDLQGPTHRGLSSGSGAPGGQTLDLRGDSGSTITQELNGLTPGASYTLSFSYAIHDLAGGSATANVSIADLDIDFSATNVGTDSWLSASYTFTAANATETLSFSGLSSNGNPLTGVMIDGVSVTAGSNSGAQALSINSVDTTAGSGSGVQIFSGGGGGGSTGMGLLLVLGIALIRRRFS